MFTILNKQWRNAETRLADTITLFAGSMSFVYLHALIFVLFFIFRPLDIAVFNIVLSLEAVFLATFIMVAQNRAAEIAQQRAEEEEREEEEAREDLEEEFEDIQKDVDEIQTDIDEIKLLVEKLEHTLSAHTKTTMAMQQQNRQLQEEVSEKEPVTTEK